MAQRPKTYNAVVTYLESISMSHIHESKVRQWYVNLAQPLEDKSLITACVDNLHLKLTEELLSRWSTLPNVGIDRYFLMENINLNVSFLSAVASMILKIILKDLYPHVGNFNEPRTIMECCSCLIGTSVHYPCLVSMLIGSTCSKAPLARTFITVHPFLLTLKHHFVRNILTNSATPTRMRIL